MQGSKFGHPQQSKKMRSHTIKKRYLSGTEYGMRKGQHLWSRLLSPTFTALPSSLLLPDDASNMSLSSLQVFGGGGLRSTIEFRTAATCPLYALWSDILRRDCNFWQPCECWGHGLDSRREFQRSNAQRAREI